MRCQKRKTRIHAFNRGYQAAIDGHSKLQCPFSYGERRHLWIIGWREGKEDYRHPQNTSLTRTQRTFYQQQSPINMQHYL